MTRVPSTLQANTHEKLAVRIPAGEVMLEGDLIMPRPARGLVLFAHGSGSSRHSPRNQFVATTLQQSGCATLLFDLLTRNEEAQDARLGHFRFDIGLLTARLLHATSWANREATTRHFAIGYFGSSTGAAAALEAAAELGNAVSAVVSRGGRPDLAIDSLARVTAPTLLIVGGRDDVVLQLNEEAFARLSCRKEIAVIPGATHLFEEPGALEQVARHAAQWFQSHFATGASPAS